MINKTKIIRLDFVKLLSDCNISIKKGELIKDLFHVHSESMENIFHLRTTQDYFKHVHTYLISRIKKYFLKQGGEFVIKVNDSPYSFNAEAMSIHIIDEDKWIVVEFLAGCNIY